MVLFDDETIIEVYPSQNFTSYNTSVLIINYTETQFKEFNLSLINYVPKNSNNKILKLKNK